MEIDVLRAAFDEVALPDERTVTKARARLMTEIARPTRMQERMRSRHLRLFAVAAVAAASVTGVFALVIPRSDGVTGPEIAEAAARVLTPPPGVILHSTLRNTLIPTGYNGWRPSTTERWASTGPRGVAHERSAWGEWETGPCGSIRYDRRTNLLTVDGSLYPDYVHELIDPAAEYLVAYHSGHVRYRGTTTFRGIPAYELVVSYPSYPLEITYTVRRDNYYPLRTVRRHKRYADVYTYSDFGQIARTPATEQLLHVRPRPRAFVLGGGGYHRPKPGCAGFRSYEHLTGKGKP